MTINELVNELKLTVFAGQQGLNKTISSAYCSDLLSDVMGNAQENNIWITLQTHKNAVAVAVLKDLSGQILVNNHQPNADAIEAANEEGIPLLGTEKSAFEICGLLYPLLWNK